MAIVEDRDADPHRGDPPDFLTRGPRLGIARRQPVVATVRWTTELDFFDAGSRYESALAIAYR
jgi:hypothetical protein